MFSCVRSQPLLAALLAGLVSASACSSGSEGGEPRLVLLYATCTLNRHYIGPYNPDVKYTPALDAFAAEGTVFSRHSTECGQSGIAFASILSGTQADRHGVYVHPAILGDGSHLIPEAFAERGYETHFWSGHYMAAAELGYGQGVAPEHVHSSPQLKDHLESASANDAAFAALLDRLKRDPSLRAYVQVFFTATHAPYTDLNRKDVADFRRLYPDEWPDIPEADLEQARRRYRRHRGRLERDLPAFVRARGWTDRDLQNLIVTLDAYYKAGVWRLDSLFGRTLARIREAGLLDQSLIAFTADHGEVLWREHTLFKWSHGLQLSPDVTQVPLIVRLPGRRGVPVYTGVSRSIDVHPTLLGLAGLAPKERDPRIDGVDLSAAVRGEGPPPHLRGYSHTMPLNPNRMRWFNGWLAARYFPSEDIGLIWTAVRDGDTYVRRSREPDGRWVTEAFDLAADPAAAHDVFDHENALHRDLEKDLEAYKARLVEAFPRHHAQDLLSRDEVTERLRAMGYIQ
jgi:arylsulfatase A-like enzyme